MTSTASLPPLSRLYRESFDEVWAILRRLGVPDASLEDAVQDVFVVVHRRREAFEGRCAVRTWLFGIARRVAFRHRRTEARTLRRHRALAAVPTVTVDANEEMARHEAWVALQRFLEELERPQREAFVLGELQRLNRRELGVALGVNPDTAYSRLRAARARFSAAFAEGRPSSRTVLAAGRHPERPAAAVRQRVWLALGSATGMVQSAGSAGSAAATAWGLKTVLTTLGLAGAVLGMVATVDLGARPGSSSASTVASRASAAQPPDAATTRAHAGSPVRAAPTEVATASMPPVSELEVVAEPSRRASGSPAPSASESSPAPSADTLAAEASLLRTAHAALARSDAAAALDALHEHRRRFLHGVLAEERDAAILRAQCALGRHAQAQRDARRFVAAHPRSAYLEALADSCVAAVTNPAAAGDSRK